MTDAEIAKLETDLTSALEAAMPAMRRFAEGLAKAWDAIVQTVSVALEAFTAMVDQWRRDRGLPTQAQEGSSQERADPVLVIEVGRDTINIRDRDGCDVVMRIGVGPP